MEWKQTLEGMSNSYDLAQRILQNLTDREILPLSPCVAWELENNRCETKKVSQKLIHLALIMLNGLNSIFPKL